MTLCSLVLHSHLSVCLVIAAATVGGKAVLHTATVVKMLQNILIGPIVLIMAYMWNRNEKPDPSAKKANKCLYLMQRFPPFIIGFFLTSTLISFTMSGDLADTTTNFTFWVSEWFATLGFVCIGLDMMNVLEKLKVPAAALSTQEGESEAKKGPSVRALMVLYIVGQTIDMCTTMAISYGVLKNHHDTNDDA